MTLPADQSRLGALERLREAVESMRHAQKAFFRGRAKTALDEARREEKRVDEILLELHGEGQKRMF